MKRNILITAGALVALATTSFADTPPPDPWSLDVGLNYVTGKFGFNSSTDVWLQTTAINFEDNVWHFQASLPFVSIKGPASVIGEVGRPTTSQESGLGDVTLAGTYKFSDPDTGLSDFDFTVRVKLPTADENKGLGTGETDTDLELNYHHKFGTLTPFVTAGYRILGSSSLYPLESGFYSTAGVATPFSDDTVGGLAFSWRQRIVDGGDPAEEAMAFISHKVDEHWKAQGYVLTGFTDASPDLGIGGLVSYKF